MSSAERDTKARLACAALAASWIACAVDLDDDRTPAPDPDAPALADTCTIPGATGRVRVLTLGDEVLVLADARDPLAAGATRLSTDCADVDLAPLDGRVITVAALDVEGAVLSAFTVDDDVHAFVALSDGFDTLGVTVAAWDTDRLMFVTGPDPLFAESRPTYGDAVLVDPDAGHVYAYGCASSGFLAQDCFVARAPVDRMADPTAWTYYQDGNVFARDPDDAWPLFGGGHGLTVRRRGARVLVAYATPLGSTIEVRTGLGPTGPWSPATSIATCEVPSDGFCTGFTWAPALDLHDPDTGAERLALTYAIASFEGLSDAARRTRLTRLDGL